MENMLTNLSFDEWIRFVFDHPVTDPEWYWAEDHDFWDPTVQPRVTVSYLTKVFKNPVACLTAYTDSQIDQGLWYVVHEACSNHMLALTDKRVPLPERLEGFRSIFKLFDELFLPRCSANLLYMDEKDQGKRNPLDSACYMWWDLMWWAVLRFPDLTPSVDNMEATADMVLDVIIRTLALNSDACRESALHGLGHWHAYDPPRIERIVDDFLANYPHIRPELLAYAQRAREGRVL